MTKYLLQKLQATKKLNEQKLIEYGFTNHIPEYYYLFKIISNYQCKNGNYLSESINITFEKHINNTITLNSIYFLYERGFIEVKDYKDYFDGKIDYSMLDEYCQEGVKVAESILQDLIDKGILELKEK